MSTDSIAFKWFLASVGGMVVVYCMIVLGLVATSPDIRVRCLLVNREPTAATALEGVEIRATPDLKCDGPRPESGDILTSIGGERVRTFLGFSRAVSQLRNASIPGEGMLHPGLRPSEHRGYPPLVEVQGEGRLVAVEFWRAGWPEPKQTWLWMQSIPMGEVVLSFVWFCLQLIIFALGALAFWNRPFDRPARVFFVMCIVTLGGFIGGYHWWIVCGRPWTSFPLVVCAMLLPVVTLHFFLIFPKTKPPIARWPKLTMAALYGMPVLFIAGFLGVLGHAWWSLGDDSAARAPQILSSLEYLRQWVYVYVTIAAIYFALTIVALGYSFFTTRNPIEHIQVKWILWAGLIATIPIGYTIGLAFFQREEFALGKARLPMFLASLLFMIAYAVGIVRHKLMLLDQIVTRGMLYYVVTYGATILYSLSIAVGSLVALQKKDSLSQASQELVTVGLILMLGVILLSWFRDGIQQIIDRRFFREKYQLDKALRRMSRAVGHLVEPQSLAVRMLGSCRDVLGVTHGAFYRRNAGRDVFELIAAEHADAAPLEFRADEQFLQALLDDATLQRANPTRRGETSPVQSALRQLGAHLVHGLETDGVIGALVILGPKENGGAFTAEDVTFLNAIGQTTAAALHSAKVHLDLVRVNEELRLKVEKIGEQQRQIVMLQAELTSTQAPPDEREPEPFRRDSIRGNSPAIQAVLQTVRKVAGTGSSVLIRGESGTGKELLAQAIHENSPRRNGPIVGVHCASLSPSLLESELFGHVKGAFTGAHRDKMGRFEMANEGTLFLDEIGDISLETQIKLLRVLQERSFEPVGGSKSVSVDVRLIAATHQNLEELIARGAFREDLYYRLNVVTVTLPPLREREEDVFELAFFFLTRAAGRAGKRITHLADDVTEALKRYDWPGNIRELENVIERAVVMAESGTISLHDLPPELLGRSRSRNGRMPTTQGMDVYKSAVTAHSRIAGPSQILEDEASERGALEAALKKSGGNKAFAARLLGLPRSTYYSKLKKYNIG